MKRAGWVALLFAACFAAGAAASPSLKVISAGPVGEVATLAEANEVRVVFSEPMVVLGRIPAVVSVPWFHISPQVKGVFRWSGTTTLIFTPQPRLPFATTYDVMIGGEAASVAGNTLDHAYQFSFTTPTARLTNTNWYRKPDHAVVIALRFNQPVTPAAVLPHVQLRTLSRTFKAPVIPPEGIERLKKSDPQSLAAFEARKEQARAASEQSGAFVFFSQATEWDQKKLGAPARDLVVIETRPDIPPDIHMRLLVTTSNEQEYAIDLEPTLFVDGFSCSKDCDPDSYNAIVFRAQDSLSVDAVRKAVTVTDITDPAHEATLQPHNADRTFDYPQRQFSFDDLGYSLLPAHDYLVRVDPRLAGSDGQTLGYAWMGVLTLSHRSAFVSFGDGQGVWESNGGTVLPFSSRNFRSVQQWLAPLTIDETMPALQLLSKNSFRIPPAKIDATMRKLTPAVDKIQSFGLNIGKVIGPGNHGLLWAAVNPGQPIPGAKVYDDDTRATLVQVTNLGITVKDSPQNVLVLVTALDTARPVSGANVSIRDTDNKVVWSGVTDENGLVIADARNLRVDPARAASKPEDEWESSYNALTQLHFIVVAEKDGDVAYTGSDWNEGIQPWEFGVNFDLNEARPLLRGTIFSDRGVYKLGEEIHFKTIVRSDTPSGMQLLPAGTKLDIELRDSHDKVIDKRTVALNEWSSTEWTFTLPAGAPLGDYSAVAKSEGQRLAISGQFLVAAYRRPDFRVDASLEAAGGPAQRIAGTKLNGKIAARYLHGGAMAGRDVKWTYSKIERLDVPGTIRDRFAEGQWSFLGWDWENGQPSRATITTNEAKLNDEGDLALTLQTDVKAGAPFDYELEGDVTDVTRQHIAGRASVRVDPAPWYIGLKSPSYFADSSKGLDTTVIAVSLAGTLTPDVPVHVELTRIQWNSVRRAVGNGFYDWDTERKEIPAGKWDVKTAGEPVPLHLDLEAGGEYRLVATASDSDGRSTTTSVWFYAVGGGYTAWERYDHNRIDLVPEKKTYKPGDTARIMIKSPWESATALLTTEREGVRTSRPFTLTSTQQTVTVPITEDDIPNLFVSVLLIKGRTKTGFEESADPGKPAFRLGVVELTVQDDSKRLDVRVKANRDEYRPASKANIDVSVQDRSGKPAQSEVTLWAVDYGVLSLTAYQTPDVLESIYLRKALQVATEDSRQRIVSRRVITPKGAGEGGGGGRETGAGTMRKDFRVLAFWVGSVVTDAAGHATTSVTLPESLTTYRIMAVAGDRASRFGWAQDEIKVNKPLMLTPAFPRFMAVGDKAFFGGVVNSQKISGKASVTIRSLDPSVLDFIGTKSAPLNVKPNSAAEVRFDAVAKSIGTARVQMRVKLGKENDAFEEVIPVRVLVSPETVAAYGQAKPEARETIEIPSGVVPGFGGLHVELSSTMLVGLAEGAEYLVTYPYGCAEQRASGALALVLTSDLGEAFHLPGVDPVKAKPLAQSTLRELENYQCGDGGFAYWPGQCFTESPYLTSYVLHVYQRARKLGYETDSAVLSRAYDYLDRSLGQPPPVNEGWWPAYTAWQAFAVRTLAEGGRNVDSHFNRVYGYIDRMPVFGLSDLAGAMIAKGERGARFDELHRRITNAILPEGGQAHVGELSDPYLLWFWNSNVRSTAIVLGTLVRAGGDEELVTRMVRWLMTARKKGRWGNTQENAWAMESLIDYYRKYEADVPDFTGTVTLGAQPLMREEFHGRTTEAKSKEVTMPQVLATATPGTQLPIVFERQGTGTLFYLMRLRYASTEMKLQPLDAGFSIERTYRLHGSATPVTSFHAGDLLEVTLHIRNTKERRYVAVTDPIPAGTEPVETAFATTAQGESAEQQSNDTTSGWTWWERGGFDHVERHDDRVDVFATRLGEGDHDYRYLLRATTAGTFIAAPSHAEEMYEPEVFGRTATSVIEVEK